MTVSNAFARPDQLSDELRRRILDAADELGYAGPDPAARGLARGSVGAVGIVLTDSLQAAFDDDIARRMLRAVTEELVGHGSGLTLLTAQEVNGFVPARDIALDGAIVYSCEATDAIEWLDKRRLPVVVVDQPPTPAFASVNIDDRGGARSSAEHVVGLGHRRIGIVIPLPGHAGEGPLDVAPADVTSKHNVAERVAGWTDVLAGAGCTVTYAIVGDSSEASGFEGATTLLTQPAQERPTALLAFSDRIAIGAIAAARAVGLRVPVELSVVGFDDITSAATNDPPLTTVRQDVQAKGALAVRTVFELRASPVEVGGDAPHHLMPTELVVRASTAAPAKN